METFLLKKRWSDRDWIIFDRNIDILIRENGLKRGDFSRMVGVINFFRKDRKRVSLEVIDRVCQEFNVKREWLETPHSFQKIKPGNHEDKNISDSKMSRAFISLAKIYESGDKKITDAAFSTINALADLIDGGNSRNDDGSKQ